MSLCGRHPRLSRLFESINREFTIMEIYIQTARHPRSGIPSLWKHIYGLMAIFAVHRALLTGIATKGNLGLASHSCNFSRVCLGSNYLHPMFTFIAWIILFILCWPLAILALVLYPVFWILTLPFRILGIAVEGVLGLIKGIIMLPGKMLQR